MGGRKRTWEAISFEVVMTGVALIALIVIIAPSLVVLIVSFTNGFSLKFPPPGYSARWYVELWNAWQLHFAAKNSFVVAMWSTGLSIVLGVAAALAIARSPRLSARVLDSLFMSPLVLPALAFGLSALMLFSLVGMPVSPLTLVIGHTVVCVPYVVRNTVAALAQLETDPAGKFSHSRRQPFLHLSKDRIAPDPPRGYRGCVHRFHVLVRQCARLAVSSGRSN